MSDRQAHTARCEAYNSDDEPGDRTSRCVRPRGHTGKHDDLYSPPWGDRDATAEQTIADAERNRG